MNPNEFQIAHQVARHSSEKLSWMKFIILAQILTSTLFDTSMLFSKVIIDLTFDRPNSRKCESEADYIGKVVVLIN